VTTERERLDRNRAVWSVVNADFSDGDAEARWAAGDMEWGLFGITETELGLLGGVDGARVAELGCGTAYVSAWLARAGAHVVAVDLSPAQLATARRCQGQFGVRFPLVEANAEDVPLRGDAFDLVVSEYGASPWCDPARWVAEAARLLRPGGRLVFLTNSVLAGMCAPAEGGPVGESLLRSPREIARVAWPGGGIEHHPAHGDWIRILRSCGLVVDALHELHASPDSDAPDYYGIATREWAARWPVEDVWVAHRPTLR
jgi:SAM-dependent methyltransferase